MADEIIQPTQPTPVEPKKLRAYRSTMLSNTYLMPNGKAIHFVNGAYYTDKQDEIDELEKEIAGGNPYLYINKEQIEVVAEDLDPMTALRKKFFAEFMASQARAEDPNSDKGSTDQRAGLNPVTTAKLVQSVTAASITK